jgi:hypothetical protein
LVLKVENKCISKKKALQESAEYIPKKSSTSMLFAELRLGSGCSYGFVHGAEFVHQLVAARNHLLLQ